MADPQTALTKEVLPPQKPSSGFGVLMVASLAMFFAIASSAFVLRARMVRTCPGAERAPRVVPDQQVTPDVTRQPARAPVRLIAEQHDRAPECGTPEYRTNTDGSTTVFFEVCPPGAGQGTLTELSPSSVEVHEIR